MAGMKGNTIIDSMNFFRRNLGLGFLSLRNSYKLEASLQRFCTCEVPSLLLLAFTGSVGMTFLIIACAIHTCWWPMIVVLFYILAPLPTLIARRQNAAYTQSQGCMDFAIFLTMGIVVSSFALPIIFSRAPSKVIETDACYLTLAGNIVIYLTYIGFFVTLFQDDSLNYGLY